MKLKSISCTENPGTDYSWQLEDASFQDINLIVGKNASGKTRLVNILSNISKLLRGELRTLFSDTNYSLNLETENQETYLYELDLGKKVVLRERLSVNQKVLLERNNTGAGRIFAQKVDGFVEFESPADTVAAVAKRDRLQHPFLEELNSWAAGVRAIEFGTPLGRDRLYVLNATREEILSKPEPIDVSMITELYIQSFEKLGPPLDQAILKDLELLGYPCTDVGVTSADKGLISIPNVVMLYVKERDIAIETTQITMSQGMFRALALTIYLNSLILRGLDRTILIDDMGEGLDFSRSQAFISLLIEKAKSHNIQILMTTNDRFVMNGVPLEHWGVLHRSAGHVRLITKKSHPKIFEDFGFLGLNNFDFFSSSFLQERLK